MAVADRVERPLSLFDELEAFAPSRMPEREPVGSEPAPAEWAQADFERAPTPSEPALPDGERRPANVPTGLDRGHEPAFDRSRDGRDVGTGRPEELETGASLDDAAGGGAVHVHGGVGGEPTLDDMLVAAWEGLTAQAVVACPVCDGALQPIYGDAGGASPVIAGRCDRCGTTLS
ncbi:MAG TPA: hypothetical protein VGM91_21710 [Conexibacter sp.]